MKNFLRRYSILILVIIVVVLIGLSFFLYRKTISLRSTPEQVAQKEAVLITEKVGRLIVLPEGEVPTIATVSDPAALADQAFFSDAKTGDKVLIYTNAKKAILYDPILNKIVNVAPLNIGEKK